MPKIYEKFFSELELVEMFGTAKQKHRYKEKGRFTGNEKSILLRNARRYCDVDDLGSRSYKISNVKDIPITKTYEYLHSSMYQYICPQILKILISQSEPLILTTKQCARTIDMINDNYSVIKNRCKESIDIIKPFQQQHITVGFIREFFGHTENMISEYINNVFAYMKEIGLIKATSVYMVVEQKISNVNLVHNSVNVELEASTTRIATAEDLAFYAECIEEADKKYGIQSESERYYGSASNRWSHSLYSRLAKRHIQSIYKTNEITCLNKKKCKMFLETYPNEIGLIDKFTAAFSELIISNAKTRFEKNPTKYTKINTDYVQSYACITSFVIGLTDEKQVEAELNYYADKSPMIENHEITVTEISK